MLLLTWHGTVVGLQAGGGGLVQVAPGQAVPDVTLLDLALPDSRGAAQKRITTSLGPLTVAAAPGGRGLTLARYGQYLCAELADRTVNFNRAAASSFETFLPLTDQDLRELVLVLGHSGTDGSAGQPRARQAAELASGFRIRRGGIEVDLAAWLPQHPALPQAIPYERRDAPTGRFSGKLLELLETNEDVPDPVQAPLPQPVIEAGPASSVAAGCDVQAELTSWALAELAFWRLNRVSLARCEEVWTTLNQTVPSVFLFHFRGQTVTLVEKPLTVERTPFYMIRVNAYLKFFTTVANHLSSDCDFTIALGVSDRLLMQPEAPLFGFQKTRGTRTILVPDIDFLVSNFHEDDSVRDTLAFSRKTRSAIFVGATTGGAITAEVARTCSMPRLRAARYFQGHQRIGFFLPAIVQCDTAETRQILEDMAFCQEQRVSWQEQFTRRFVISMDGNGATCSRVAIALRSNSVLIKYASAEILYYFHGLQEWLHYVPVAHDRDLDALLDLGDWSPRSPEEIAYAGKSFAERFLTRDSVIAYTVTLLSLYSKCFGTQAAEVPAVEPGSISEIEAQARPCTPVAVLAHVQNTGDRMSDPTGWAGHPGASHPIEGFQISRLDVAALAGITCRGVLADGSLTPPVQAGAFCGTRGKGAPLHGFVLEATGNPKEPRTVLCEGRFKDASHVGPLNTGEVCQSPSGAPLTAMRICLER